MSIALLALASVAAVLAVYVWRRYNLLHHLPLTILLLGALATLAVAWVDLLLPTAETNAAWSLPLPPHG